MTEMPPTRSLLVIGYGNVLCGDDGVGWLAAEALLVAGQPSHVRIITRQQLTLDLVLDISRMERLLFIDARLGTSPGRIECIAVSPNREAQSPLEHHIKPELLLAAYEALYRHVPQAYLLTIESQSFKPGEGLSDATRRVWPQFMQVAQEMMWK